MLPRVTLAATAASIAAAVPPMQFLCSWHHHRAASLPGAGAEARPPQPCPTAALGSPVGAPIAHIGLHVGAVTHNYDTDLFLPPH